MASVAFTSFALQWRRREMCHAKEEIEREFVLLYFRTGKSEKASAMSENG